MTGQYSTNIFKEILMDNESLFRNEEILDFEYLPEILPFREEQQMYIATVIKPLFNKRKPNSLFINGSPGIGKTASVRKVFKDMKEYSNKLTSIYVNCWEKNTQHQIIKEISRGINYIFNEGKSTKEIIESLVSRLNEYKGVIIALDEIDKAESHDFLYEIAKVENVCLLLIANNSKFLSKMDPRVRSRINMETLEFKPYSLEETRKILLMRRKQAFLDNIWVDSAFDNVVSECYNRRDIRTGLFLLREAGRTAESKAKKKIEDSDFETAKKRMLDLTVRDSSILKEDEKLLIELIKKNEGILSGTLYNLYKSNGGDLAERSFRRYMEKLELKNIIEIKETSVGFRGHSSRIYYKGY